MADENVGYKRMNADIDMPVLELESRLGLDLEIPKDFKRIIPLRDLDEVKEIRRLEMKLIEKMFRSVSLVSKKDCFPYRDSRILMNLMDTNELYTGQKIVVRSKISKMEDNSGVICSLQDYYGSLSGAMPSIIYGSREGENLIAFYMSPLVERHGNKDVLTDGTHRSMASHISGKKISCIHILDVHVPTAYGHIPFNQVRIVDKKPVKLEERYIDFDAAYLRDFCALGFDP